MSEPSENVTSLFPTAPEALDAAQLEFAEGELHKLVGHIAPIDSLPDDARELFRRHAYTAGEAGMDEVERKMRNRMRDANVPEKDVMAFKMAAFRRWAKQRREELKRDHIRRQKVAKANLKKTQSGREDTEITALEGDTSPAAVDSISQSVVLQAHSWLVRERNGRVWHDTFSGKTMSDWDGSHDDKVVKPFVVEDDWVRDVWFTLMREDGALAKLGQPQALEAIMKVAYANKVSGPQEWLRGLVWDKQPRLEHWVSKVYGTPQDAYHAAVGRCWIVSMVARVNVPGCKADHAPVLYGPEGTYKSTSVAILGGEWGGEVNVGADKQDFLMVIRGKMIVELPELDSLMNRHTTSERVKTIITTRVDEYRAPYARLPIAVKRTAIMVGTTNNFSWHKDDEGGRRFWPICCTEKCDTEWLAANREQMFAEAMARYVAGESWHDVPVDDQKAAIARHYSEGDPLIDRLEQWLSDARFYTGERGQKAVAGDPQGMEEWECWGNVVTTSRIMTVLMQLPVERQLRPTSNRIAAAMRRLGWTSALVRLGSGRTSPKPRVWVKSSQEAEDQGQLFDKVGE